jgi:hypothetical protein
MTTEWPKYVSHKVVQATPIIRIDKGVTALPLLFVNPSNGREPPEPFFPTEPQMATRCQVLDYAMIYRDGYRSVCPKQEFDAGYSTLGAP